jgi:ubiquinone/menaquinone biosynthesis C-methylase UbiE
VSDKPEIHPVTATVNPDDHPAKVAWRSAEEAAKYRASRDPSRFTRYGLEEKIVTGWLSQVPAGGNVLDAPCGTGRMLKTITSMGLRYTGLDISQAMIEEARKTGAGDPLVVGFRQGDLERLPFADNEFDCVVLWRLMHHMGSSAAREAILREARRVSRDRVLMSFHHAISWTAFRKWVQRIFFGRKQHGRPITHWTLAGEAERSGLQMVELSSFGKYRSINWFACLRKAQGGTDAARAR